MVLRFGECFQRLISKKWDKTQSEKVHLRFCELFLGLNRKASNYAAWGEMGRFPLQLTVLKQILKYNLYLNSKEDSSTVKQSLYISDEINKNARVLTVTSYKTY